MTQPNIIFIVADDLGYGELTVQGYTTEIATPLGDVAFRFVDAVDAHERAILEQALARHRYNQRQTAKALSLSYDQLRHAMKKHGLSERG